MTLATMQLQDALGSGGSGGGAGSSIASAPNGALDGHKLLYLTAKMMFPSEEWVKKVQAAHPGLEIVFEEQDTWRNQTINENLDWANFTILLTGGVLPTPEQAPKLQLVQLHSAGANHVLNKPIFTDTKIKFCTANGVHGPQIAEWVICTFLALNHKIPKYLENQRKQKWEWDWSSLDANQQGEGVDDCVSKRVGILGYGSIGRQVARVAKAMGMDVVAYTNHPRPTPESRRDNGYIVPGTGDPDGSLPSAWYSGTDAASIDEFLGADLDLLVIAVPLTPLTRGLIGEAQFKIMAKRRTFISNIARGPIVNTDALMKALDEGWIRGAALDVTDPEPLPDGHPLFSKKNLIITPHVSSSTRSYGSRTADILEMNLDKLSKGEDLINVVNRKEGY